MTPEKYRFLDYYQYHKSQDDFTSNFRLEAQRLHKCLEYLVKNGSDLKLKIYLMSLRRVSFSFHFDHWQALWRTLLSSTATVSACVPLTLWRSLDPVMVYKFCRGGGLQQS